MHSVSRHVRQAGQGVVSYSICFSFTFNLLLGKTAADVQLHGLSAPEVNNDRRVIGHRKTRSASRGFPVTA